MTAFNYHLRAFTTQYSLPLSAQDDEIIVDLFAGGGGASTGLEMGLQRPVTIAINHNPAAISMHTANHPHAQHYQSDVWAIDPVAAVAGRKVGWLHASPDCTHHSQAAGGQPRKKEIRDLSWVVIRWAGKVRPRVISLENVKQIRQWGPLIAKRDKATGRVVTLDMIKCPTTGKIINRIADPGERVPRQNQYLVPDTKRKGATWRRFLQSLRGLGYQVDHWVLKSCDYGDPTIRERLYLVARCDGVAPKRPVQTHAAKPAKGQRKHRTAAECMDWSDLGRSIFGRPRPLADATLRRIAKGVQREVLQRAQPFIVPATHQGGDRVHSIQEPLRTVTAAHRGELMLATAFLAQANGGFNATHSRAADAPISTVTNTGSQQQLVTAQLVTLRNNCVGGSVDEPLSTIAAGGEHHALVTCTLSKEAEAGALRVASFLMHYYSEGGQWGALDQPIHTITTKDRLALVTVWISGDPYVVVDIRLRMLKPRELYRAQGFPESYIIERGHDGRLFTKSEQVHMCGNSVSPKTMGAIATSNNPWTVLLEQAA